MLVCECFWVCLSVLRVVRACVFVRRFHVYVSVFGTLVCGF